MFIRGGMHSYRVECKLFGDYSLLLYVMDWIGCEIQIKDLILEMRFILTGDLDSR